MTELWHLLVVLAIIYISWRAFGAFLPRLEEHAKTKLHLVNSGIACVFGQLIFMFILYIFDVNLGVVLPSASFLTWTITLLCILSNSNLSALVKRLGLAFVIAPILLTVSGGTQAFLRNVDGFAASAPHKANDTDELSTSNLKDDQQKKDPSEVAPQIVKLSFTPSRLLKAVFFFFQVFLITNYYGKTWHYWYQDRVKRTPARTLETAAVDQIIFVFSLGFSLWISFIVLGFDTLSVSVFSGLVLVGVSMALRDLITNFASGMLLLWEKSVKVGDVITFDKSRVGQVIGMTMRYLVVEDRNDIHYLIPHAQLTNTTLENWTLKNRQVRLKLDIAVAYDSPIDKVKDIMRSVCFEVPRVLKRPLPNPLIISTDDSAIHFQLRFRIADPELGIRNVMSDVYERLLERFKEAEIEIPFPQREIRFRSPDRLDRSNHPAQSRLRIHTLSDGLVNERADSAKRGRDASL
jgi:small-conductance mechanosensitive channel